MDGIPINNVISIGTILLTGVVTFLATRHNIENKIRDKAEDIEKKFREKVDELNKKINELEKEQINLKHRDEMQQQVIDEFRKQVLEHLPKLYSIVENSKSNSK